KTEKEKTMDGAAARLNAWVGAFASQSAKAMADNYAPDARLWGTIEKVQDIGSQAIAKYFENTVAKLPTRKVVIGEHPVRVYGSTAVASGRYDFQFTLEDGTAGTFPARFSMVFVKSGETWLIVDHHSSPLPK